MIEKKGKLIIISAPSGTGKSTVIHEILRRHPEFEFSVSATTRPIREKEVDGVDYFFITRKEFERKIAGDEFLEWAEYVGNYYGTPKDMITKHIGSGKIVILDIEVQGALQVMQKVPSAISVFIVPPSMEELEKRLRGRGTDSEEKLRARLKQAGLEMTKKEHYKHIVVNDTPERAALEIEDIISKT